MKPLLASLNLLEIHHLKNVLEADGIRCWVKNELLLAARRRDSLH